MSCISTPIAITTGEPAGIGPEVSLKAALALSAPVVLIGDRSLLMSEAHKLGIEGALPRHITINHVPLGVPTKPGRLDVKNVPYVIETLARAHDGVSCARYSAIVTAPVQKSIINDAGIPFSGHTEFFQEKAHVSRVVMMLVSSPKKDALRVALATTHVPIRALANTITGPLLDEVIYILNRALCHDFAINRPRIGITGLNPHAGESGHIGTEEIDVIIPAVKRAIAQGVLLEGPLPADTIFVPGHMDKYDAILCMYHDQGLPVLKHVGFGLGVNITLGLPYIRTSVDHGTALDIAGTGTADIGSMISALELAHFLAKNRETRKA